MISEIRIC